MPSNLKIILASGSQTRWMLLERLQLNFTTDPADIDESPLPDETPKQACIRLAASKAEHVQKRHPDALIIGSDQILECNGAMLGKPGNAAKARAQLQTISGQEVFFHVGLTLIAPHGRRDWYEAVRVKMRQLDSDSINTYLQREQPFSCAGSMRSEGLGSALVESMHSQDPSAIMGMPMIATARCLRELGVDPLAG